MIMSSNVMISLAFVYTEISIRTSAQFEIIITTVALA